ncbi:MAG TPA: alpha/beta hydrolase family protein [Baekduia sp.]|uniref:alpha/beta hydrolase n=1 Tax=Baekduia sp. TaxID=2600305 RepID=UPI002D787D9F|nr:alpha/beta hydrolase family protein [Baekduia sp.]HET6508662.1 alpha/beta hydrolase family protein [Baekduia sp.]
MRKLLLLMVLALVAGPAAGARASGLELVSSTALDDRLTELTFTSPSLADPVKVRVLLPRAAAADPSARYPSLYLLHGSDADASNWTDQLDAEELTEGMGLVVVMPDGGSEGWYTNWPKGAKPRWEDFHVKELIPWIDAHEPVLAARSQRAIAGLSMGGFGAMSYAARHPDLFAAAASFSGADDLGVPKGAAPSLVGAEPWGSWDGPQIAWRGHNPYDLAANLRGVALSIYTGEGEGGGGEDIEPVIFQESASLAARLRALGIPRTYVDYGRGGHDPELWSRDLKQTLPWLSATFAHPATALAKWSFRATERTWTVRGYTVRAARDRLSWRSLTDVTARSLRVSTDSATTIRTSTRYAHRTRYRVTLRLKSGATRRSTVRSAGDGSLTIAVPGSARIGITRAAPASGKS